MLYYAVEDNGGIATEQGQLEKMVGDLSMGLSVIKHEQEYMEVRERLHRMSK